MERATRRASVSCRGNTWRDRCHAQSLQHLFWLSTEFRFKHAADADEQSFLCLPFPLHTSHLLSPANLSLPRSTSSSSSFSFPVDQKFHSNSIGSASILRTVQRVTATEAAGAEGHRGAWSENFCYKCVGEETEEGEGGTSTACGCYVALSESLSFVISWLRAFLALRSPQNKKCNLVTRSHASNSAFQTDQSLLLLLRLLPSRAKQAPLTPAPTVCVRDIWRRHKST